MQNSMQHPQQELRPKVSVVVPARNEARNLRIVLAQLPDDLHEVILVDGNSVDDTIAVAREVYPDVRVVTQTRNGKGNALACGFAAVTGDVVVMLDADGSAKPDEIPSFVKALTDGARFAKGSRFTVGGHSHDITMLRKLGNAFLNGLVNTLFGTRFSDLCYGYNAFEASLIPIFDLPPADLPAGDPRLRAVTKDGRIWGDGFEIETLINLRVAAIGALTVEVGSVEDARIHGRSNLNALPDGLRVLRTIFSEYRRARRGVASPAVTPMHAVPPLPVHDHLRTAAISPAISLRTAEDSLSSEVA